MVTLGIFVVLQGTLMVNQGTLVITTRVTRYLKVTKLVLVKILGMFINFFFSKRQNSGKILIRGGFFQNWFEKSQFNPSGLIRLFSSGLIHLANPVLSPNTYLC